MCILTYDLFIYRLFDCGLCSLLSNLTIATVPVSSNCPPCTNLKDADVVTLLAAL